MKVSHLAMIAALSVAICIPIGCKEKTSGTPSATGDATTPNQPAAPPQTPAPNPAATLAPPDVKLIPLAFKINNLDFSIDAPEGSTVETELLGVTVRKGKDFGFTIEPGKGRFIEETGKWRAGATVYSTKEVLIDRADEFLVESKATEPQRFWSGASATFPYIDLTIRGAYGGLPGDNVMTRENCLIVLKCAKTLALKSPVPQDPEAVLHWLGASATKTDDKVTGISFASYNTDAALAVVKSFPTLKTVSIGRFMSPQCLALLEGMKNLEAIEVVSHDDIPAAVSQHIAKIPNLISVSIGSSGSDAVGIDEPSLAELQKLTRLQILDLSETKAGDAALAAIKGILPSLQVLRLAHTHVDDDGLQQLAGLKNLRELDLASTKISDATLKSLSGLVNLQKLNLRRTNITDAGLQYLKGLSNLEDLNLESTKVTDAGLLNLYPLKKLTNLHTSDTAITDAAKEKLDKARGGE